VAKAFGNPKVLDLLTGKIEAGPLAKVRGTRAKIDGNIPDMACEYAHKLTLGFAELIMKASQDTPPRKGLVVLREGTRQASVRKSCRVEDLREPTTFIAMLGRVDELNVDKWRINDLHNLSFPALKRFRV
jgi:hypothetical protein